MTMETNTRELSGYPKGAVCRAVAVPEDLRQRFIDRLDSCALTEEEEIRKLAIQQEIEQMQRVLNNLRNKAY